MLVLLQGCEVGGVERPGLRQHEYVCSIGGWMRTRMTLSRSGRSGVLDQEKRSAEEG